MTATTTVRPTWTRENGWSDGWTLPANIAALETEDYQNRDGRYPRSDVPDGIRAYRGKDDETTIEFQFKNTTESTGKAWVTNYLAGKGLNVLRVGSNQSGDYQDDWIDVRAHVAAPKKVAVKSVALPAVVKATPAAGANEQRKVAKKLAIKSINAVLRGTECGITFKSGSTTTNRLLAYKQDKYLGSMMPEAVEQYLRDAGVPHIALVQIKSTIATIA